MLTNLKVYFGFTPGFLSMFMFLLFFFLEILQGSKSEDLRNDILDHNLIPLLVYLACQGTELSRMWLLRDLEVSPTADLTAMSS